MMNENGAVQHRAASPTFGRSAGALLIGWLAMLGIDFFLHAGLLAGLYIQPSPFLRPPLDAFRLIPVGYIAFLLQAGLLLWLMQRTGIGDWRQGVLFGLQLGLLVWGALLLALFSISTAAPAMLIAWFAGQSVEMAVAGAVIGSALGGETLSRLLLRVVVLTVVLIAVTIAMQSLGLAPATRL